MRDVSVLIPVGPKHVSFLERARVSAEKQTIPVNILTYQDVDGRGSGYARNRLLEMCFSRFLVFLDADDRLEPTFVEDCLAAFDDTHYVYTDWFVDDKVVQAAEECWCFESGWQVHVVTSLLPVAYAKAVGGFDESLPGMEDTEFYMRLAAANRCGKRLAKPLVHYQPGGERSNAFRARADYLDIKATIGRKFEGKYMSCCGQNTTLSTVPQGEQLPGDIQAEALWVGVRTEHGRATGRIYPRMATPERAWVDPRDVAASPNLWRAIQTLSPLAQIGQLLRNQVTPNVNEPYVPVVSLPTKKSPDVLIVEAFKG